MFGTDGIRKLLSENYPLLSILIGITARFTFNRALSKRGYAMGV